MFVFLDTETAGTRPEDRPCQIAFKPGVDWTASCLAAVTNLEIEELWRAVPDGTPVEIKP